MFGFPDPWEGFPPGPLLLAGQARGFTGRQNPNMSTSDETVPRTPRSFLDDDGPLHRRVDLAVVGEGAGALELRLAARSAGDVAGVEGPGVRRGGVRDS